MQRLNPFSGRHGLLLSTPGRASKQGRAETVLVSHKLMSSPASLDPPGHRNSSRVNALNVLVYSGWIRQNRLGWAAAANDSLAAAFATVKVTSCSWTCCSWVSRKLCAVCPPEGPGLHAGAATILNTDSHHPARGWAGKERECGRKREERMLWTAHSGSSSPEATHVTPADNSLTRTHHLPASSCKEPGMHPVWT